jgi:hypothetical protein
MIKTKYPTYHERRTYIWNEFVPVLEKIESTHGHPSDTTVSEILAAFDQSNVHDVWQRALARREEDPEGAITLSRTLLETVCKFILDDMEIEYSGTAKLPKLYHLVADNLGIAPSGFEEQVFKQILGGAKAVVEGLGALRNKLSDAHGAGKAQVRPLPRHAHLAVNLSGSISTFLVETYLSRSNSP